MIEWRDVVGYEGLYQVSSDGQVRSLDRVVKHGLRGVDRVLKGRLLILQDDGVYLAVKLSRDGKAHKVRVHVAVSQAHLGKRPEGFDICHGVLGQHNNSVSNLSYGSRSDNTADTFRDGTHRGMTVRRSDGKIYPSMGVAAKETGCSQAGISKCCDGKLRSHRGFQWEKV